MSKSSDRKNINSTLMYGQIAKVVFAISLNDEFICRVAETPRRNHGVGRGWFDYVSDFEGEKCFGKRK